MSLDQADQVTINDQSLDQGNEAQADLSASVWEEMDQLPKYDSAADQTGGVQQDSGVLDFSVDDPFGVPDDAMTAQMSLEEEETLQTSKSDEVVDELAKGPRGDEAADKLTDESLDKVTLNQNPEGEDLFPEEKNGDIVEKDKDGATIIRGEDGRIKSTTSPRGRTTTFDYDEEGDLKQVNMPGSTIRKNGDRWEFEKDGEKEPVEGHVDITPDGDLVHLKPDGTMDISHPDGSRTAFDETGSQVTRGSNGVERTVSPKGTVTEIEYDADGEVDKIKMKDTTIERAGDKWVKKDAAGNKIDEYEGSVDVDQETGNLIFEGDDGTRVVSKPDGTQEITNPDGSVQVIEPKKK